MKDWLPAILAPVVSLAIAWLGYRQATRTKQLDATATPYSELARRVVELEKSDADKRARIIELEKAAGDDRRTIRVLMDDRDELVAYLAQLREWVGRGSKPPAPTIPAHLRDVIRWQWDVQDSEAGPDAGASTPKETPNA